MEIKNLVKMANQIGAFFEAMPDRAQAMEDIAGHIKRSWEPKMRLAILRSLDEPSGHDLKPIVREALHKHKEAVV